jgi:Predicted hydrolase of the alpha/beta-hydrolase fold
MTEKKVKFGDGLNGIVDGVGKRGSVIITHGAGQGMDAPLLKKTSDRLVQLGFLVLRFNFGYMGKRPAPSQGGKNEQPELVAAIEYMNDIIPESILIGKSFGARVNSYVAATRADVRGLVYYGLPLQGMSKTSKPRDWSHLTKIKAPMLFITGDKDNLCPLGRLAEVQEGITVPFQSKIVKGDHSFKPKSEDEAVELCIEWVNSTFEPS